MVQAMEKQESGKPWHYLEHLWRNNTMTGTYFKAIQGEGSWAEPRQAMRRQLQLRDGSIAGRDQVFLWLSQTFQYKF